MHSAKAISDLIEQVLRETSRSERREQAWDERLARWERPASDSEEATIERAAKMVRDALATNSWIQKEGVIVDPQGSYHNNTNVRQQADMDLRVVHPALYVEYSPEVSALARLGSGYYDLGRTVGQIAGELRSQVESTLRAEFGAENIDPGNKAFRISSVPGSRSDIDVVPALTFNHVLSAASFPLTLRGIIIFGRDGSPTVNFPVQHYQNGVSKRDRTTHRFKKVVRTLKSLRDDMVSHSILEQGQIPSFLIECLVYRVDDGYFLYDESRLARLRRVLNRLDELLAMPKWTEQAYEINDVKWLFGPHQGWTVAKAHHFVRLALAYLEPT